LGWRMRLAIARFDQRLAEVGLVTLPLHRRPNASIGRWTQTSTQGAGPCLHAIGA